MKENLATEKPKYQCEFCNRNFLRKSTIFKHICEQKQRYLNKDLQGNRIGFQAWVEFYKKNSSAKKTKTYEEFIKSSYYTAFVKFGNYCVEINCINVSRFCDWLLKNQIRLDTWASDTNYNKFLLDYIKTEDPLDAIHRSVETTIKMSEEIKILPKDFFRFGNTNKICYAIVNGKISPWMLYQSNSGVEFLDKLNIDHVKMIVDYIDPEKWALKFHREPENVRTVKEILHAGGY